jgi:hypothetical protein
MVMSFPARIYYRIKLTEHGLAKPPVRSDTRDFGRICFRFHPASLRVVLGQSRNWIAMRVDPMLIRTRYTSSNR